MKWSLRSVDPSYNSIAGSYWSSLRTWIGKVLVENGMLNEIISSISFIWFHRPFFFFWNLHSLLTIFVFYAQFLNESSLLLLEHCRQPYNGVSQRFTNKLMPIIIFHFYGGFYSLHLWRWWSIFLWSRKGSFSNPCAYHHKLRDLSQIRKHSRCLVNQIEILMIDSHRSELKVTRIQASAWWRKVWM